MIMKNIFKLIFWFSPLLVILSCAGQMPLPQNEVVYQEVIEISGKTKEELYENSLKWMAEIFNSSKAVIQYQNKDNGEIIGKGILPVKYTFAPVNTNFTLIIEIKDEKIRMTFKDMGFDNSMPFNNNNQLDAFKSAAFDMVYSLQKYNKITRSDW